MAKRKASSNMRKAGAGADEVPALRVHIVRRGDTLGALARYYLGSSSRADEIKELNCLTTDCIREEEQIKVINHRIADSEKSHQ